MRTISSAAKKESRLILLKWRQRWVMLTCALVHIALVLVPNQLHKAWQLIFEKTKNYCEIDACARLLNLWLTKFSNHWPYRFCFCFFLLYCLLLTPNSAHTSSSGHCFFQLDVRVCGVSFVWVETELSDKFVKIYVEVKFSDLLLSFQRGTRLQFFQCY